MEPGKDLNEVIEEVTVNNPVVTAVEESVAIAESPVVSEPVAPVVPEAPRADTLVFAGKPKKKGAGMVLGMILLALLAAGGIGFGVWAMMDKNTETDKLNSQITTLRKQNVELQDQIIDLQDQLDQIENNSNNAVVDCLATPEAAVCSETVVEQSQTNNGTSENMATENTATEDATTENTTTNNTATEDTTTENPVTE